MEETISQTAEEEEEEKDHRQRIKEGDFELDGRGGFHGYLYIEK